VIAAGDTDWRRVTHALSEGPAPQGRPVWYQKHMTHHLLPSIDEAWIAKLRNVLLIRDPREVIASYVKSRASVTPEDIGLPQQVRLHERLSALGMPPPVIDAGDFLRAPEAHLRLLCAHFGIGYTPRMLAWPRGPRDSDGIWAPHWYERVWASTGFESPHDEVPRLTGHHSAVASACMPAYECLRSVCWHA
jgi:hypothetical protein